MSPNQRLVSLDAFRGFIMLLMVSSGFGLVQAAKHYPDSWLWQAVAGQMVHTEWRGGNFWDMIQPAFMFMVGMAAPFSMLRRQEDGQTFLSRLGHAILRAVILILLGVFLSTKVGGDGTNWIFPNVLAQIGLGYVFLFLLTTLGWEYCAAAAVILLVGDWYWFLQHPLPGAAFDYVAAGARPEDLMDGRFGHWSKNLNAAADFDRWFLNLFPRSEPFLANAGGYTTLNFIPSLATMLMGSITGAKLLSSRRSHAEKAAAILIAGIVCLLVGVILNIVAIPAVKRIWTPSWALLSAGWVFIMLSAFYWLVEVAGKRKLVFPLVVVGMNSLFVYILHSLAAEWIRQAIRTHVGAEVFAGPLGKVLEGGGLVAVLWLLCWWLYRQKAFLRI